MSLFFSLSCLFYLFPYSKSSSPCAHCPGGLCVPLGEQIAHKSFCPCFPQAKTLEESVLARGRGKTGHICFLGLPGQCSKTQVPKTAEIYCLRVLEARSPKSRSQQGPALGESCFFAPPASAFAASPQLSLAFRLIIPGT